MLINNNKIKVVHKVFQIYLEEVLPLQISKAEDKMHKQMLRQEDKEDNSHNSLNKEGKHQIHKIKINSKINHNKKNDLRN